jgi:hypothetical protein
MITSSYLNRPIRPLSRAMLDRAIAEPSILREQLAFYDAERSAGIVHPNNWPIAADFLLETIRKRRRAA